MKKWIFCALLLLVINQSIAASPFKVAAIEFNPQFHQRDLNFQPMALLVKEAAEHGAKLILFPEMSTTGYLYAFRKEIAPYVDTIPGKTTDFFAKLAKKYGVYIVVGMPEKSRGNTWWTSQQILVDRRRPTLYFSGMEKRQCSISIMRLNL